MSIIKITTRMKIVVGVVTILLLLCFIILYYKPNQQAGSVVIDPEGGQRVLVDVLTVMRGRLPEVDVVPLLKKYEGKVIFEVPETGTYAVRFPVTSLDQLKHIKKELIDVGLWVTESIVMPPSNPNGPQ